jgi:hypothetical protein
MKIISITLLFLIFGCSGTIKTNYVADHTIFDKLLNKYIKNGKIDYGNWKNNKEDYDLFKKYVEQISQSNLNLLKTKEQKLAFWINVYNAEMIKIVLEKYPIKSIKDGLFGRLIFFKYHKVGGKRFSLYEIENKILRKLDEKIHFTIVCASESCPLIQNRAFFVEDTKKRLNESAEDFINNPDKVKIDTVAKVVHLSKIFKWYEKDFGSLTDYISTYVNDKEKSEEIRNGKYQIKFQEYNWKLNDTIKENVSN